MVLFSAKSVHIKTRARGPHQSQTQKENDRGRERGGKKPFVEDYKRRILKFACAIIIYILYLWIIHPLTNTAKHIKIYIHFYDFENAHSSNRQRPNGVWLINIYILIIIISTNINIKFILTSDQTETHTNEKKKNSRSIIAQHFYVRGPQSSSAAFYLRLVNIVWTRDVSRPFNCCVYVRIRFCICLFVFSVVCGNGNSLSLCVVIIIRFLYTDTHSLTQPYLSTQSLWGPAMPLDATRCRISALNYNINNHTLNISS